LVKLGEAMGFPTVRAAAEILNNMRPVLLSENSFDIEVTIQN
jgi:hypothetical protein